MDEKKISLTKKIEDTLACSAFAEAGEACPLDSEAGVKAVETDLKKEKHTKTSVFGKISDDFACTAFHDQNESCPICEVK